MPYDTDKAYAIDLKGAPQFLKIYYLNPQKRKAFRIFFETFASEWLKKEGVYKVDAWLVEYPSVGAQPEELVLVVATNNATTDWYEIPGIEEFLRRTDQPKIENKPKDLCFSFGRIKRFKKAVIEAVIKAVRALASRLNRVWGISLKVLTSLLNR